MGIGRRAERGGRDHGQVPGRARSNTRRLGRRRGRRRREHLHPYRWPQRVDRVHRHPQSEHAERPLPHRLARQEQRLRVIERQPVMRRALLVLAVLALAIFPGRVAAHPLSTTAVLLDIGEDKVTGQLQLPLDRLAYALDQRLTADTVATDLPALRAYVRAHISAGEWAVTVSGGRVQTID